MTAAGRPADRWPSGSTLAAGVIGYPVRHSLSPLLHNAAFAACGLDWAYLALEVRPGDTGAAVAGARALGFRGLSVTMPLKAQAAASVDRLTPTAAALGAVNTIVFGEEVVGDSTDGAGFVAGLPRSFELQGTRAVVVGAGGAARAVVLALARAGAAEVAVLSRSPDRAAEAAELAGAVGRVLENVTDIAAADLVVNATPAGMAGTSGEGGMPFDPEHLRAGQVFVELVYNPRRTPLMEAASAHGASVVGGISMLVNQAAAQFTAWTGLAAPLEEMQLAVAEV